MSDDKPDKPRKGTVIRARFAHTEVKIGGNELMFWAADRHSGITAEAKPEGLVFRTDKDPEHEDVVPWPNVGAYTRVR